MAKSWQWKPVKTNTISASYRGGGMASSSMNNQWYERLITLDNDFNEKLDKYRTMDTSVDISRALDIIAEDIASDDASDNNIFSLNYPEESNPKNAQIKTSNETLNLWEKKTKLDYRFFGYMREMIKNGFVGFEIEKDGGLIKLIPDRIKGYMMDEKNEHKVKYYLYDRDGSFKNSDGKVVDNKIIKNGVTKELEKLEPKNLLILKLGEEPLGQSILEKIYRIWRQLQLLEDAVVIYRIVRAPERRVFYIDIGKMPSNKAESYMERIKNKMRQKQINKDGNIETDYNPSSMIEDFFISTSSEGRGSRVETLPGGENLGRIEDLQYFNKKLALGLRIPPSYLDSYSDDPNGASHGDGRVGTAYVSELRYAGFIRRLQREVAKELFKNLSKFANKLGTEFSEDVELFIAPPQNFAVYSENEKYSTLLNTYASSEGIESLSKKYSLEKFMGFDKDEMLMNEECKLMEMGFSPKDSKELPDEIRYNFIYGDGESGRNWVKAELEKQGITTTEGNNQDQDGIPQEDENIEEISPEE